MAGRQSALHKPTDGNAPAYTIGPQSANAANVNGSGIDLSGKRGAYFVCQIGVLTGLATVAFYLQDSADNSTFANVNTTTYPEATVAASNTANSVAEMSYSAGAGQARYVRAVSVAAVNAALHAVSAHTY